MDDALILARLRPQLNRYIREALANARLGALKMPLWRTAVVADDIAPGDIGSLRMDTDGVDIVAANAASMSLGAGARVMVLSRGSVHDIVSYISGPTWVEYEPQVTAATTDPGLGTSPIQQGHYSLVGQVVTGQFVVVVGSSPSAGSGTYYFSLPVAPLGPLNTNFVPIGTGRVTTAQDRVVFPVVNDEDAAASRCRLFHAEHVSGPLRWDGVVSSSTSGFTAGLVYNASFTYLAA